MTKQSRKDLLKREDAFLMAAEQSTQWLEKHRTPLAALLAGLFLVAVGIWGTAAYLHKRDRDAALVFSEGWAILENGTVKDDDAAGDEYDEDDDDDVTTDANATRRSGKKATTAPTGPQFATEKDKWAAARAKFDLVLHKARYRGIGTMAALLVGDLSDKLEDFAQAETIYGDLQKHLSPDDHLFFLAAERYAYLREKQGDPQGAIAALADLATDDKHFYADYAQFHQARLYVAQNSKDKARTLLEHLERSFPNSSLMEDVHAELAELGGGAAGDVAASPQEANGKGIE